MPHAVEDRLIKLFKNICHSQHLGELDLMHTKKLTGGRIHDVWRLKTDKHDYVIKVLNPNKVKTPEMLAMYKCAETIAKTAEEQGVNAVSALRMNDQVILIQDERYYLLFPFVDGKMIRGENIELTHAEKMGEMIAKLHLCRFDHIKLDDKKWEYTISRSWHSLLEKVDDINIRNTLTAKFASLNAIAELDAIHDECLNACAALKSESGIISHGDLDCANILWTNLAGGEPTPHIIDWEYSGRVRIHPLRDLIASALYWSQIKPSEINVNYYQAILAAYQAIKPFPDITNKRAALYAAVGGWMQWIDFNIQRLTDPTIDEAQKQLAAEQIAIYVETVITVKQNEDKLLLPFMQQQKLEETKPSLQLVQQSLFANNSKAVTEVSSFQRKFESR